MYKVQVMSHTAMVTEHRFASPQTNVTKPNNQERTKRYDCIPLPTKSATASNPNPATPLTRTQTMRNIQRARDATQAFLAAPTQERRRFATHLLFTRRS